VLRTRAKIEALRDAAVVAEHIGEIQFQQCPACYAPLDEAFSRHACHLCKTPFDSERTTARMAGLIMDTGLQVRQSEQLQSRRGERLAALTQEIKAIESRWAAASHRLTTLQKLPSSAAQEKIRELNRKAGYLERQLEDLEQKARLAETIAELSERKAALNAEITRLKSANEAMRAQQQERMSVAYTRIADEVKRILKNDLRRQDTFEDPQTVLFTFERNKIAIDDETYFSASSRAILRSSFFLGFLAAATKLPFFRHPRFCMIDTHENMGVEVVRSHNFQLEVLRVSRESPVEHQVIIATAMIAPELDSEDYTVGAFSTSEDKTIEIQLG
jgi:hypothetical protein